MKKKILLTTILLFANFATAETYKVYICKAENKNSIYAQTWVTAPDMQLAIQTAREAQMTDDVSCVDKTFTIGKMQDLENKKWGFQGIMGTDETYLIFKDHHLLHVQECGKDRMIHRFKTTSVGENKLQLSVLATEGECNPHYVPVFKDGSVLTLKITRVGNDPFHLSVFDRGPEKDIDSLTLYKEIE